MIFVKYGVVICIALPCAVLSPVRSRPMLLVLVLNQMEVKVGETRRLCYYSLY